MTKVTLGSLCYPPASAVSEDDETTIDYIDISSVDNIAKRITGYQTLKFVEAPSRARKEVKTNSILVSTVRPNLNAVAIMDRATPNKTVASTGFCVLDCKGTVCPRFVFNYCRSKPFIEEMISQATGASYPAVSDKTIRSALIPDYSYSEQQAISNTLDKVDKVIQDKKRELSLLDDLIKARFVEMFGDVITNSRGWAQYLFSEIATSRLGKMLDAKQQTGEHRFPYLANFNVQWFRFALDSLNEMDFNEDDQKEFELKDGDLLVCEGGEIGRCAVWHNDVQPCFFQKALHRVRCDTGIVLPDYLARWFQYNCEHGGFASIEGAKATIAHLPGAKLKALQVVVPPIELQERFISFVAQIDKSKSVIQTSLDETQLLFDSLMQKYFG